MGDDLIFLGIDPASTKLAMVAIKGKEFHWGRMPHLGPSGHVACNSARTETLNFLDSLPWTDTDNIQAYIEDPIVGRGGVRSTMVQAFTSGAVQGSLHEWGCEVFRANVSSWKKHVVGKGNATKDEVRESLRLRWPALFKSISGDQDLCDATCIALYGRYMVGE